MRTSLVLMPSIDLKCFSMIVRSLRLGMLFVIIDTLPGQRQINSAHSVDLIFLRCELIWKM